MKAILLAAGKGTRLRPLTLHTPKCLVPICEKPLLEYWFDLFRLYGIDEILINTSHLADKVSDYLKKKSGKLKIKITYEENLLGSGGTLKKNWKFVRGEEAFFICYADNLTNINLSRMLEYHTMSRVDFTLGVSKVTNPEECGIVDLDENNTLKAFEEKPDHPVSDMAFSGIMVSSQKLSDYFPEDDFFDLGHDVLPLLTGKATVYIMNEYLLDIGTLSKLDQAEKDIHAGVFDTGKSKF
jgi:mannose-1-phosphate guanylyltransferase